MTISDRVVAYLRTTVPALWGALAAWILTRYALPAEVADLLNSDVLAVAVTGLVVLAWYAVWRWLEPHVPDWLTRLALGSAKTPTYGRDLHPDTYVGVIDKRGPAA